MNTDPMENVTYLHIYVCSPHVYIAAADLVPDISFLKTSLESFFGIQEREMYTLQCALEEGCLSSSARPNGNPRQAI